MVKLSTLSSQATRFTTRRTIAAAFSITALTSLYCWTAAAEPATSTTLTITSSSLPPISTSDGTGFENLIAKEMFRRLGIEITFNILPAERTLVNLDKGYDDGTLSRIGGLAGKYKNLTQIDESVVTTDYVAFSRKKDIQLNGWDSLKPYTVGIITGWKILERNIKGTRSLTKARNAEQLFSLLDLDRVDLVIFSRLSGLQLIKDRGLKGIQVLEQPLARKDKYFYLHKKHRELAVKAATTLQEMKADGTLQRTIDQAIKPLLTN